ncbi:S-adenosyl-L-methionine-dependent methyltransferase, partial [Syncephalis pseudoplumigaleata]
HRIVKHVLGGNCPAATELDMCRVLDVGTGDGTWLREMARDHPTVDFVGCDIVDMTDPASMPSNCRWQHGNILHKLPYDDGSFDLIHQRQLGCYITERQWPAVARELYRLCRPGGRVVLVEMEHNPNTIDAAKKDALVQLNSILADALQQSGVNPDAIRHLDQLLKCVGFVGVYRETIPVPCGGWGGQVGRAMMQHLQMTMSAGTATALTTNRVSRVEYDALVEMAGSILGTYQSYHNIHVFVAEKPLSASDRPGGNGGAGRLNLLRREVRDGVHRIGSPRRQDTRLR